ncbi:MAG: leucine-rich repeat domain-containing protein [Cytophagia bacterium]|nr:MAG: leucine-rich repeat domain-containing protein [Cytophagia bacterium]TAG44216.1 MAG: leucine-rich repeat domain-containing protein [Cytophagia bacterium]
MENTEFENLILLLENESTFELGINLAQHYQEEFENYFGCSVEDYKELTSFIFMYDIENIGKPLIDITFLEASHKKITILSPKIGLLLNLKNMIFYNNQLTTLPQEIGELNNLQYLDLSNNQLTTLPKEIGKLERLENLRLNNNPLISLPIELKNLKNCKIYVGENPTDELREYVKDWENICYLDFE